jgi:hypothetical protein
MFVCLFLKFDMSFFDVARRKRTKIKGTFLRKKLLVTFWVSAWLHFGNFTKRKISEKRMDCRCFCNQCLYCSIRSLSILDVVGLIVGPYLSIWVVGAGLQSWGHLHIKCVTSLQLRTAQAFAMSQTIAFALLHKTFRRALRCISHYSRPTICR